jgi:ribosome-associated protein
MAVKRAKAPAKKSSRTAAAAKPARKPAGAPKRPAKAGPSGARPKPRPAPGKPKAAPKSVTGKAPAKPPVSRPASAKAAPPVAKPSALAALVVSALEDMKAVNPIVLDVRGLTDIADTLIVASGNSDRHVRSIADRVIEYSKKAGYRPMGVEGERDGEWVLVDLQDVIVHVMLPRVREFYRLEDLWDVSAAARETAQ